MTIVEAQGQAALDELLHEVRRQASHGGEPDFRKVLDWLCRQIGAEAALVENAVTAAVCTTGFPRQVLHSLAPLLDRMSGGQPAAAATQAQELQVHCEALGSHEPRPVLVVAGSSKPAPEALSLTSHVGSVIALLHRAGDSSRIWRGYQHKARQVRLSVLHALLAGEPMLARRMNSGAVPPLLDASGLRVFLLSCPPADRDRIPQIYQDPSGFHDRDLMVHCPVFKEHLICLLADGEEEGDSVAQANEMEAILLRLVRDNPRYALGVSGVHPLSATANAYAQASHALATARTTPGRTACYHGRSQLGSVLPPRLACAWARALLRPLDSVPKTSADITRMAMSMPRTGIARLLDLSRNTVAAHLRQAEQALNLDLKDVRSRAAVHLALALSSSCASSENDRQPPPALEELMLTGAAVAWAGTVLQPLKERYRHTLQAWIDTNADAKQTANHLGISRNTVRAHLLAAESALGVDLLTTSNGVHDIAHALDITAAQSV